MIYLLFLVTLLLISCNPDQAKDNGKDETIEYFIPLSHRVEKDVDEMFEEYRYVPLETRDDALIDVLYNVKNIAIFQEDIYIGSGEQLIVWVNMENSNESYPKREMIRNHTSTLTIS